MTLSGNYTNCSNLWLNNVYKTYFQPQSYTYNYPGDISSAVENVNAHIRERIRAFKPAPVREGTPVDWLSHYSGVIKKTKVKEQNVTATKPLPIIKKEQPANIKQTKTTPVKGQTVTLNKAFVDKVKQIAKTIKCDYRDLLGVINSESSFSTTIRSGGRRNGAVGLIQFTDIAIKDLNQAYGLNLTKDKIAKMSAMEQLDLTEKYLVRCKSFKFSPNDKLDSADLYAIVYRPAFAGKNIIAKKSDGTHYTKNKGLDVNKDGYITRNDLAQVVERKRVNVNLVA